MYCTINYLIQQGCGDEQGCTILKLLCQFMRVFNCTDIFGHSGRKSKKQALWNSYLTLGRSFIIALRKSLKNPYRLQRFVVSNLSQCFRISCILFYIFFTWHYSNPHAIHGMGIPLLCSASDSELPQRSSNYVALPPPGIAVRQRSHRTGRYEKIAGC